MVIRPLARSRADQRKFVDRTSETRTILRAVDASRPVLLLGHSGSGRTSLLNHVAWLLARDSEPRDAVMISGELAQDPAQLLGVLVARLQRLARANGSPGRWLEDLRALAMPDGPFGQLVQPAILMELIDLLGERLAELQRPACVMIDGIAPAVAHAVFGTLRNELWALEGLSWIVAGEAGLGPLYREPPADAFFEVTVELGPLSIVDARKLLRTHLPELSASKVETAIAAGDGNPRRLLRAAAGLPVPRGDGLADQAVDLAGPLAAALVSYLTDYGPASASDPTLLRQVGMSRQRASQLMHKLESAGLLETIEQHEPGRRGRPARRFAVKTSG
jgi:hypothetical protein